MKQDLNLLKALALIAAEQYKIEKQKLDQFDIDATKPGGISILALANQLKATKDADLKSIAAVEALRKLGWDPADEGINKYEDKDFNTQQPL